MGELADDMIDRILNEMLDVDGWEEYRRHLEKKDLQDFAEEASKDAKRDKKMRNLNKGVIDW